MGWIFLVWCIWFIYVCFNVYLNYIYFFLNVFSIGLKLMDFNFFFICIDIVDIIDF